MNDCALPAPPYQLYPRQIISRAVARPYVEDERGQRWYYCTVCNTWRPLRDFPPRRRNSPPNTPATYCRRCHHAPEPRGQPAWTAVEPDAGLANPPPDRTFWPRTLEGRQPIRPYVEQANGEPWYFCNACRHWVPAYDFRQRGSQTEQPCRRCRRLRNRRWANEKRIRRP